MDVTIETTVHRLYQRPFAPGTVTLGGNFPAGVTGNYGMYTVLVTDP